MAVGLGFFVHEQGGQAGAIAALSGAVLSGAAQTPTPTAAMCDPRRPSFYYGFAALHARLGARMGEPTECELAIHVNGDTRQTTTTGYAYYRKQDNVPSFTNGWDHWALTYDGLVYWTGDVVDPPTSARRVETP